MIPSVNPVDVRVVLLPALLKPADVDGRVIVVFDVLRATTTMTAALAAGVTEIVLHATLDEARDGYASDARPRLLVGEQACLKPDDFHLGNSPGQFIPDCAGKVLHMATTNGTKALLAPGRLGTPRAVLAGALVNRLAVAKAALSLIASSGGGVTLLCAGTDADVAYEDVLGCGAVLESLVNLKALGPVNDAALMAMGAWTWSAAGIVRAKENEPAYPAGFRLAQGAKNLASAGLQSDITFAARPDVFTSVGQLQGTTLTPYVPPNDK